MLKLKVQLLKHESSLGWNYTVNIPDDALEALGLEQSRRVICTLPDTSRFHCAVLPDGRGGQFIIINKQRRNKLGLREGEIFDIQLEKDESDFGMPMSDELREVLDQHEEASDYFMSLTPGKQRTLIYWCDSVKSADIKIRRALVMTAHLVNNQGRIDFKKLGMEIKEANNRALIK